ncbi:hypothetical protein CcaCcLH18_09357 [Colletotrichum camelliae]|nr:hypothetical protein CcaCcLH18_09357 [Colletotrichum camelliae]
MDQVAQRHRRRFRWLSLLADLTLIYLFGLIAFSLYPSFMHSLPARGFSVLHPRKIYERLYRAYTLPCYPHKDGGLPHAGCIRLLRIVKSPESGLDILQEAFPLASAPSYRALSYTWGQATGRWGGYSLTVPFEFYKGQHYMCINQGNLREREEQVGNMHRIYQQAEGVDIWLGTADENEATASEANDILRYIVHNADSVDRRKARLDDHFLPESDWDILASFFSRRWFHRLWTLQEFALASQVRIMLGDDYIDSDILWSAAVVLYSSGFPLPLPYGHNHSAGYAIVQHSTLRRCVEAPEQLLGLLPTSATREMQTGMPDYEAVLMWVFWRSAATFATDARDYIYGILGVADTIMDRLAQAMGCHTDESRKYGIISRCAQASYMPIKPDYSLDTARVFRDFIVRLMHSSSIGIRAMTLMQGGETGELVSGWELQRHAEPTWLDRDSILPSWVPNLAHKDLFPLFSSWVPLGILNDTEDQRSSPRRRHPEHNIFSSSSNLSTTQRFNILETHLHLYGRRIGVIDRSSSRVPYAVETLPCAEFGVNALYLLACTLPRNSIAGNFDPGASALETLLSTLQLGNPGATAASAKSASGQNIIKMLDERQMETFYAGCLSTLICLLMMKRDKDGKPLDVQAVMEDHSISRFARIPGLSAEFLEAQVAKWTAPDMVFRWRDYRACILHRDVILTVTEGCSALVNELPWARGRALSAVALDSQLVKDAAARGAENIRIQSQQQGDHRINLMGLGPAKLEVGDEVWALQGSEYPFVLRRRHGADGEPLAGRKFSDTNNKSSRWWWPWPWPWHGGGDEDGGTELPGVYELRGDIYVHGLMNGELGDALATQGLEEVIIS